MLWTENPEMLQVLSSRVPSYQVLAILVPLRSRMDLEQRLQVGSRPKLPQSVPFQSLSVIPIPSHPIPLIFVGFVWIWLISVWVWSCSAFTVWNHSLLSLLAKGLDGEGRGCKIALQLGVWFLKIPWAWAGLTFGIFCVCSFLDDIWMRKLPMI